MNGLKNKIIILSLAMILIVSLCLSSCGNSSRSGQEKKKGEEIHTGQEKGTEKTKRSRKGATEETTGAEGGSTRKKETAPEATTQKAAVRKDRLISWDPDWKYADYSEIHSSDVRLYFSHSKNRKNKVIAVNAGHGTSGGDSVSTLSHPDGTGKVTGGTNNEGQKYSIAVSSGMTFNDGTPEAAANLSLARILKKKLLEEGYDVLMIREDSDVRLDNIARTVFANNNADVHIALHYDSTESDKGVFYISVPDISSYRNMEPVASHWKEHENLGKALAGGIEDEGISLFGGGSMALDLTQTSYSTIPSVDLEVGDAASDHSERTQGRIADGIVRGLNSLFEK